MPNRATVRPQRHSRRFVHGLWYLPQEEVKFRWVASHTIPLNTLPTTTVVNKINPTVDIRNSCEFCWPIGKVDHTNDEQSAFKQHVVRGRHCRGSRDLELSTTRKISDTSNKRGCARDIEILTIACRLLRKKHRCRETHHDINRNLLRKVSRRHRKSNLDK